MNTSLNLKFLRIAILILLLWPVQFCLAQQHYTLDQIPDPKAGGGSGYVSDPDGILKDGIANLNDTIAQLEQKTKVQIAVVIVRDFDEHAEIFDFSLKLFRKWGIGKARADNGLLLFVATNRHQYHFITGYGLEGLLPDVALKRIGDTYLVPAFQKNAYSEGVKQALNSIADYLARPANKKELDQLAQKKATDTSWGQPMVICVLMLLGAVFVFRSCKKHKPVKDAKIAKVTKEVKVTKTGKSIKTTKVIKVSETNRYEKVVIFGCVGIFIIGFLLIFLFAFTVGFSWVKNIAINGVPVILYILITVVLFFNYYGVLGAYRSYYKDDQNLYEAIHKFNKAAWWYVIVSPLILIGIGIEEMRRKNMARRFVAPSDSHNQPMVRVNRDINKDGKPYLTEGQLAEENAGVYIYDIWLSADEKEHKIIANEGDNYGRFDECPQCKFKTLNEPDTVTITSATRSREGSGKKVRLCSNCGYEELIAMVVLPMLTDSSDSSSSSGGSSSSSDSSSSSWGGGSSGGGGAGGSW